MLRVTPRTRGLRTWRPGWPMPPQVPMTRTSRQRSWRRNCKQPRPRRSGRGPLLPIVSHGAHPQPKGLGVRAVGVRAVSRPPQHVPACAQWCIFSTVRANFQKYDLYSAPIARALPRYIVPFFKFFKTGKCFKTMLFPVYCVSQKPPTFQKHSVLLIQPKTHAKTLSERSERCAAVQVLIGTDSLAHATYLQRAL